MNVLKTLGRYILAKTKTTYSPRNIGLITQAVAHSNVTWNANKRRSQLRVPCMTPA
jgi:hypothetical protein